MLTRTDVMIDPVLSNVSKKYTNQEFIADRIMPVVPTAKQTGKYYIYDKSNLRRDVTLRAPGSGANETSFGLSTEDFITKDHALKDFIPDEVQEQADAPLNPLIDATENLTEKLLIDREKELAETMEDTSTLTENTTLSGTDQWSDYSNSDPIGDIRDGIENVHSKTFKRPNTVVLGQETYNKLIDHPQIVERIKYSQLGIVTTELLARVFGVNEVLIGSAGENTAKEGQSDSLGYIWGKHAWVFYKAPGMGLKQLTFGWTFAYKTRIVERWRDEDRKGTYVRTGNDNYTQKVVCAEAAYLIKDAVA